MYHRHQSIQLSVSAPFFVCDLLVFVSKGLRYVLESIVFGEFGGGVKSFSVLFDARWKGLGMAAARARGWVVRCRCWSCLFTHRGNLPKMNLLEAKAGHLRRSQLVVVEKMAWSSATAV